MCLRLLNFQDPRHPKTRTHDTSSIQNQIDAPAWWNLTSKIGSKTETKIVPLGQAIRYGSPTVITFSLSN